MEVGSAESAPAIATTATGANANLLRQPRKGRPLLRGRAQSRGGSTIKTPARPKSCISRSARIAPTDPSTLRIAPLVTCERLGSAADQVMSARLQAAQPNSTLEPVARSSQRPSRFRKAAGRSGV